VNPATAFGVTFSDELIRCGLREVVLAPGSRSTPLAMAFYEAARQRRLRLHVRIDERSASFTALGLAKASRLRWRCCAPRARRRPTSTQR
jgi:2-succinyl-6-hydroxy-2,4-cyclohexadiene-1-carboxylate synthase